MRLRSFLSRRETAPEGPFGALKIALVTDDLTHAALAHECRVRAVTPRNYRTLFASWKPDLLFVESAWKGHNERWRYGIASYPDHPRRTNRKLAQLVAFARDHHIPALFWNREDGVHFNRFIDSARLFDRVLTVDETMVPAYRAALGPDARVGTMMFAASPHIHRPTGEPVTRRAAFVGSYGTHVHDGRRAWQHDMFAAAEPLGLTIYDRNSEKRAREYRYPEMPWADVRPAIPHDETPSVYCRHLVNLNVNTITGSATAFSRRLVEIMACGGFVLTNDTLAVRTQFDGACLATDDANEAAAFFERVARDGLSAREEEMRRAARTLVLEQHLWERRVGTMLEMIA